MLFSFWSFWESRGRFVFFGLGIGLVFLGLIIWLLQVEPGADDVEFFSTPTEVEQVYEESLILVDVAGAVVDPGVYQVEEEARVEQAVEAAGGFSDLSDQAWVSKNLNLARKIRDGEKLYIPTIGEDFSLTADEAGSSGMVAGAGSWVVNINTASKSQLESLSGIGPSYAQGIIDYRKENNGFTTIEEIMAVPRIGEKTFEKIKDRLTI